jgi:hypothetical protein
VSRTFDWRNSLGDLLADVIGLVLGVGVYLLLSWASPVSAIVLFIFSFLSVVWAFIYQDLQTYLLMLFLASAMLSFSLFIYG